MARRRPPLRPARPFFCTRTPVSSSSPCPPPGPEPVPAPSLLPHHILASGYDVVTLPEDVDLDTRSVSIHGITPQYTWAHGSAPVDVLTRFFRCLLQHRPAAIVGHDIVGDVALLATEVLLLEQPRPPDLLRALHGLHRLVCTRMLSTHRCAIPLPKHLHQSNLHDALLTRLNHRQQQQHRTSNRVPTTNTRTHGVRAHKWPSLQESYNLLVCSTRRRKQQQQQHGGADDPTTPPPLLYAMHDARGDVERCRAIFLRLLLAGGQ